MYDAHSCPRVLPPAEDPIPATEKTAVFLLSDPGLEAMGDRFGACAGDALTYIGSVSSLRIVTEGVVAMTHHEAGLCTAVLSRGQPLASLARSGRWLTDGAYVDLPFERLVESLGQEAALGLWAMASALSRATVETELVCALRHTASRRFARWLLDVLKVKEIGVLTQVQLAELSGLQRTTVCAAMASLQTAGALKVTRGRIKLRSYEALESLSCECRWSADLWLASATASRDCGVRGSGVYASASSSKGTQLQLAAVGASLARPAPCEA